MQYMGGKSKIARKIVRLIMEDSGGTVGSWFEPFVGGASVITAAAPYFDRCVGADAHPDLIMMWQGLCDGTWLPPDDLTEQEWRALKDESPSALRGFAGFGASFGARWFEGYAHHRVADRRRPRSAAASSAVVLRKQRDVLVERGVRFIRAEFGSVSPEPGALVYCDPPYPETKRFGGVPELDMDYFYEKVVEWSEKSEVYLSLYSPPPGSVPVSFVAELSRPSNLSVSGVNAGHVSDLLYRVNRMD